MEYTAYKCDQCGKPKQESNHWYKAAKGCGSILRVVEFRSSEDPMLDWNHLCGEACVLKWVAATIGQGQEQSSA